MNNATPAELSHSSAMSYYSYYDEQYSMHNKPRVVNPSPDQE